MNTKSLTHKKDRFWLDLLTAVGRMRLDAFITLKGMAISC